MPTPTLYEQGFPLANQQLVDSQGNITYAWRQLLVSLWNRTGGGSGDVDFSGGLMASLSDTFGAAEDGTTDDIDAVDAWMADPTEAVAWIEGVVYTTNLRDDIAKRGMGPGQYHFDAGQWAPASFLSMQALPTVGTGVDLNYFFSGDLSKAIRTSYTRLGSSTNNVRKSISQKYFESVSTPLFDVFINGSGWSGVTSRLNGAISAGATSALLVSAAGIANGDLIGFVDGAGVITESRAVTVSGSTISWSGGLTNGYSTGAAVTHSPRTMNPLQYQQVGHGGGGDAYGIVTRLESSYAPLAGQQHFFETSTVGFYGGDAVFSHSGNYITGLEMNYSDNAFDGAVIASVQSFHRTNNVGALSVVWIGDFYKSEGSKPIDAFNLFKGPARIGIDMSGADFSSADQSALQVALNHRIYFDATVVNSGPGSDPRGIYLPFTGNSPGSIYMGAESPGGTKYIYLWNSGARARLLPTAFQVNVDIQCSGDIGANNLSVGAGGAVVFGAGSGNYFYFTGNVPRVMILGVPHTISYV